MNLVFQIVLALLIFSAIVVVATLLLSFVYAVFFIHEVSGFWRWPWKR